VCDPLLVRCCERIREGDCDLEELSEAKALSWQQGRQCLALHQFHGDEVNAAGLFDGVNSHDVGVVQRSESFCLSREPSSTLCVAGEVWRQDFERNLAVKRNVLGHIDVTHATGRDLVQDLVVADPLAADFDHLLASWNATLIHRSHGEE
jgi:hypothetical protein